MFKSFEEICTDMLLYKMTEEDKQAFKNYPSDVIDEESLLILRDLYRLDHPVNPYVKDGNWREFSKSIFFTICARLR